LDDGVEKHEDFIGNLLPGYDPSDSNTSGAPVL